MGMLQIIPEVIEHVDASRDEFNDLAGKLHEDSAAAAYSELWRRIHDNLGSHDAGGLSEIIEFVYSNARQVAEYASRDEPPAREQIQTLTGVVPVFKEFLAEPLDADALGELINYLQKPDWPVSMEEDKAYAIMAKLLEALQEEQEAGRLNEDIRHASHAGAEEAYDLNLPDDIHPQLVDAFFNEVPQLAEEFTECIRHVSDAAGGGDEIVRAQRLSHTIKGSANITGIHGVAALMHGCEDLLASLYKNDAPPDADLAPLLMEAADCLASQIEFLQGEGPAPDNTEQLVNALRARRGGHARGVSPQDAVATPAAAANRVPDEPARTMADTIRVPSALIENLLRQAGEVSISTVQLTGLGEALGNRVETLMKQQTLLWERLSTIQELVELRSITTPTAVSGESKGDPAVFDPLEMDEYNELHSATSFLAESITDSREYATQIRDDFNRMRSMLKQQDVLSRELNESVMGTRMVPFKSIASRLERVVRQTARSTGKSVELILEGEDVSVDRNVLTRLTDSLLHLLRNAVDHGIEDPQERIRAGKPETGRVTVHVERHGDNVSLQIRDDGKGLDYESIRRVAMERGLIQDPQIARPELARLIMSPGFTTREQTTQISGRGIGMDVVNATVMEHRGTVDIRSEPGEGLEVNVLVPMTLISVHTLLVRNSGVVVGVPSSSVQQLIFSDLGEWRYDGGQDDMPVFVFEERDYQVVCLSHLIGIKSPVPEINGPKPVPLLLVQGEQRPYAVILEEVLDDRYLVVKPPGRYAPKLHGVIGGAILGDGSVAAVVDIRELLRERPEEAQPSLRDIGQVTQAERGEGLPSVLVVDDSVSARRALAELVSDAGYRSVTAIDGIEALARIDKEKPAAILVDMEMPRMNGLELTTHLRADEDSSDIPLIMITSRSTEKHRRQAEAAGVDRYFTKPYQEDALVEELHGLVKQSRKGDGVITV